MAPSLNSSSSGRGNTVVLEAQWLQMLKSRWFEVKRGEHPRARGRRHNLDEFGVMLAEEIGRSEPFSGSSLSRLFKGSQVSDEIVNAFCSFFEIPYPLLPARHVEEIEWFQVGRMLREADHANFMVILSRLKALAVAEGNKAAATEAFEEAVGLKGQSPMLDTEHGSSDD